MDTKEIKIVPPEGYEIDKENSTFECIKFKPIKRWRDGNPHVDGWDSSGDYIAGKYHHVAGKYYGLPWKDGNLNIFATKKQAKSALAMAQISQIMANDERFGGPVTDEEWKDKYVYKFVIYRCDNSVTINYITLVYAFLAFHTSEQRDLFLKENEDLVKDYLMLE